MTRPRRDDPSSIPCPDHAADGKGASIACLACCVRLDEAHREMDTRAARLSAWTVTAEEREGWR